MTGPAEPEPRPALTRAQWADLYRWLHDTPPPEPADDPRPVTRLPDIATWEQP